MNLNLIKDPSPICITRFQRILAVVFLGSTKFVSVRLIDIHDFVHIFLFNWHKPCFLATLHFSKILILSESHISRRILLSFSVKQVANGHSYTNDSHDDANQSHVIFNNWRYNTSIIRANRINWVDRIRLHRVLLADSHVSKSISVVHVEVSVVLLREKGSQNNSLSVIRCIKFVNWNSAPILILNFLFYKHLFFRNFKF